MPIQRKAPQQSSHNAQELLQIRLANEKEQLQPVAKLSAFNNVLKQASVVNGFTEIQVSKDALHDVAKLPMMQKPESQRALSLMIRYYETIARADGDDSGLSAMDLQLLAERDRDASGSGLTQKQRLQSVSMFDVANLFATLPRVKE